MNKRIRVRLTDASPCLTKDGAVMLFQFCSANTDFDVTIELVSGQDRVWPNQMLFGPIDIEDAAKVGRDFAKNENLDLGDPQDHYAAVTAGVTAFCLQFAKQNNEQQILNGSWQAVLLHRDPDDAWPPNRCVFCIIVTDDLD